MNDVASAPLTRWGLNFISLLAAIVALRLGETVFIPTVLGLLLAALLWPTVLSLHHALRVPWGLACFVSVLGLVVLNIAVTLGFALSITKTLQQLPNPSAESEARQEQLYRRFRTQLERVSPVPLDHDLFPEHAQDSTVFQYVKQSLRSPYVTEALLKLLYYANNWMWQWVLVMFILLFLLLEGRMLSRRVAEIFGPRPEAETRAVKALSDMAFQVRNYLVWRTLINIFLGLLVGLVYYLLGLKQPWTWALLTGVMCYVPYLGPIVAGVPPILDALLSCPTAWYALGVFGFYLVVITLEGYVIVPVVMGRSMELNATTVMLACLFWDLVWGLPGLFLAMPLMAALKAVCYHVPGLRPWANLMSTASEERPEPAARATSP